MFYSYGFKSNKYFNRGIHVNSQFVLLSQMIHTTRGMELMKEQTTFIWYKKKYKLVPGFQLPDAVPYETSLGPDFAVLNSTHVVVLVGFPHYIPRKYRPGYEDQTLKEGSFAVMSFYSDDITLFSATLPMVGLFGCRFTIGAGGSGKEIESKLLFCACVSSGSILDNARLTLLTYDLKHGTQGQWKIISDSQRSYTLIRKC